MHKRMMRYGGALFFAGVLALAGCSGEDGDPGPQGPQGPAGPTGQTGPDGDDLTAAAKPESCAVCHAGAGAAHQGRYDEFTNASRLTATIDGVVTSANPTTPVTYTSTLTFTLRMDGQPYVDLDDPATTANETLRGLKQKRFYATEYDRTSKTFTTATNFSWSASTAAATGTPGQYRVTNTAASFDVEDTAGSAFVYAYFAAGTPIVTPAGHYNLYPDVYNVGRVYGAAIDYQAATTVQTCQRCHPTPYAKHGYRAAVVPGLPDFVACKACHTDQREGSDQAWQILVDDPLAYTQLADTNGDDEIDYSPEQLTHYAYRATLVNDTHMSHAMEFAYPQSMSSCVTCHEGKLDVILTDANFTLETCKSCHPVTAAAGTDPKRAPALLDIMPANTSHAAARADLYTYTGVCNTCHAGQFPTIHKGYDARIYSAPATAVYSAPGAKYSSAITTTIDSVSFASATNLLTVHFSVAGANAAAIIKPTVVISLYGYDTKDFVVGGHASQPAPDGKRNLEWAQGASGNSPRLTVSPATATAGNKQWVATADLTLWAAKLADGSIQKAEIGILPAIGLDQTVAPQNTATNTDGTPRTDYNPYIAAAGATKTFDLAGNAVVADAAAYGKAIVDTAKCNACHDALGTTFHSPAYGGSGVVACRLCHVIGSGGSHLEMQSRSIDSYVHAIHSFQVFDIGDMNNNGTTTDTSDDFPLWDFTDPVDRLHYDHHVGSTFPNFTILNCESCHVAPATATAARAYDVPAQSRSLPGLLSKADPAHGWDRTIGGVPAYVTGPASRACGGCHRAKLINANDGAGLAAFNGHTEAFGYMLDASTDSAGVLDRAIQKIMSFFE